MNTTKLYKLPDNETVKRAGPCFIITEQASKALFGKVCAALECVVGATLV